MMPDEYLALQEAQRAFYEKAQIACIAFLEKHGVCPQRIGVKIMQRRLDLLYAVVEISGPDLTRYTVPWYSHEELAEDDMLLWEPSIGIVTLKELGL